MLTEADGKQAREYLEQYCKKPDAAIQGLLEGRSESRDLDILIPCYNQAAFLPQCVDSVVHYPFHRKVGFILLDDGSTDGSEKILDSYAGLANVTVLHQENSGLAESRNVLIRSSSSRYIFFLDSDDYAFPQEIERMLDYAIEQDADAVEGRYQTLAVGEPGPDLKEQPQGHFASMPWSALNGYAWGKILRAGLFERLCYPKGYLMEDGIMGFLVAPLCRKVFLYDAITSIYRLNPDGITARLQGARNSVHTYWLFDWVLDAMPILGIEPDAVLFDKLLNWVAMTYTMTRFQEENAKAAIFFLSCLRLEDWNRTLTTENRYHTLLQKALLAEDYSLYCQACELVWRAGVLTEH